MFFRFISRNESRLWSPHVVDGGRAHPYKISLEAEQQVCSRRDVLTFNSVTASLIIRADSAPPLAGVQTHRRGSQPQSAAFHRSGKHRRQAPGGQRVLQHSHRPLLLRKHPGRHGGPDPRPGSPEASEVMVTTSPSLCVRHFQCVRETARIAHVAH